MEAEESTLRAAAADAMDGGKPQADQQQLEQCVVLNFTCVCPSNSYAYLHQLQEQAGGGHCGATAELEVMDDGAAAASGCEVAVGVAAAAASGVHKELQVMSCAGAAASDCDAAAAEVAPAFVSC